MKNINFLCTIKKTTPNQSNMSHQMDHGDDSATNDETKRQGLLALNDLTYLLEPDLSVATNVTQKNHHFQGTTFSQNQRAICIINSGADYIDTRSSYLKFSVKLTTSSAILPTQGARGYFGVHGSAMNFIKNVTVTTRSGDEISRVIDANRLFCMSAPYRYDSAWIDGIGQGMGYSSFISMEDSRDDGTHTFCIPLYCLTDFFGYGRLMPSMIMSGLRIEIEFEGVDTALQITDCVTPGGSPSTYNPVFGTVEVTAAGTAQTTVNEAAKVNGYTVTDPVLSLKSVQLTDATQRALNELSATNGLELVFTDFERTETVYPAATQKAHIEIRKACSRALCAMARVRTDRSHLWHGDGASTLADSYQERNIDSFASEPETNVNEYQWQLGSLYFPQQPIKGNRHRVAMEGYLHTVDALGKLHATSAQPHAKLRQLGSRSSLSDSISGIEWTPRLAGRNEHTAEADTTKPTHKSLYFPRSLYGQVGTFVSYGQTWHVGLERSSLFELAGVPINNSRVLALRMGFDTAKKRTIDVYLKYVKLARLFLNNVEVEQ